MRILVVEDERKVASFIKKGLEAERMVVDLSDNGQEGLDLALFRYYDLLILDLMLPKICGSEVLKEVREEKPDMPVLILTARDALPEKLTLFSLGCDDYLTKPFSFAELVMRVRALTRRGPVQRIEQMRVGDLELNRLTRRVTRAGRHIDLTAKEFVLLEYLMTNRGHVCSRSMIIEHVWDHSFDSLTNIVDVYIRYVRNKIDRNFEMPLIHTVRGVGYVLSDQSER